MKGYADNILGIEKKDRGVIAHRIKTEDGKEEKRLYADIRCGLFWPAPSTPAVYIILGQEYIEKTIFQDDKPEPPPKLIFMLEREMPGIYLDPLFKQLSDDCTKLGCSTIYTDLDETQEDIQNKKHLYDNFCNEYKVYIPMQDAPFRNDWQMGVNLVRGYTDKGLLSIPDGATRAQLSAAVAQDLDAPDDANLYSLRALQFVIGAFYKSKATNEGPFRPNRRRSNKRWRA